MYCPNCGKEYQENQNFCRFCGAKLNDDNSEKDNPTNNEKLAENVSLQENAVKNTKNTETPEKINTKESVDLTIKTQISEESDDKGTEKPSSLLSEETDENNTDEPDSSTTEEDDEEQEETLKEEVSDFFTDLKNSLIIETPEGKKLTPSAITLLVVLFIFVVFMGNLLWSINDAIQINPSMTNENALMNIPNDNEDGAYTQTPEPKEEENTEEEQQESQEEEPTFAEQPQQFEEPPLVPIEEVRQREQQYPEPEIPEPQEFTDAPEH